MIMDGEEESLVEFKGEGKLLHEVPNAFQPLRKDGRNLLSVTPNVTTAVGKLVSKLQPLFAN